MPIGIFTHLGLLVGVPVDLILNESHNSSAYATEMPIEDGTVITDHIHLNPDIVVIDVEMSNVDFFGARGERARTALAAFRSQLKMRGIYQVMTHHHFYPSMALTNISADNEAPFGGRLLMMLEFTEINRTRLEISAAPESSVSNGANSGGVGSRDDVSKTASSTVNAGRQDAVQPEDVPQRAESWATQLTGVGE